MKVKVGDTVSSNDFGSGVVVAMSEQWCTYRIGKNEYALLWEDVFIDTETPDSPVSSIKEKEV